MATQVLVPRHIFGLKSNCKDNVWFMDDGIVVYPAGNYIVLLSVATGTQRFIPCSVDSDGITAVAISPSLRYIAVAEQGPKRAVVNVFDLHTLKRRKNLSSPDVNAKAFVSMCFSADNKLLVTQSSGPDWSLTAWQWEKSKPLATTKIQSPGGPGAQIYQCSCSPLERSVTLVTGDGVCAFYRIQDQVLKPLPTLSNASGTEKYLCHAWLPEDRVIVGTDGGSIVQLESGNFSGVLSCSPSDGIAIRAMSVYSGGFICGCDNGIVRLFELSEDDGQYSLSKSMKIHDHENARVCTVAISPTEDMAVFTLSDNQMFTLKLDNLEMLKETDMNFTPTLCAFHGPAPAAAVPGASKTEEKEGGPTSAADKIGAFISAEVSGMDRCARKPLIVTCGIDRTVKVWNYLTNKAELSKTFTDEPCSVSMHPSGLHILVGFADKLRYMNLLMDDIRVVKEFPIKNCRETRFSEGGHYFAAVNGTAINVYTTYTCELVGTLRGHNSRVQGLYWTRNDLRLLSAGKDGALYSWDIKEQKREGESVLKGCQYTSVVSNIEGNQVFAVGSDSQLKAMEFQGQATSTLTALNVDVLPGKLAITRSARYLFAGTTALNTPGHVIPYKMPLVGDVAPVACLSAPITRMAMSFCDEVLFLSGEDGCLMLFDVKDKDGRGRSTLGLGRDQKGKLVYAEEVLVTKGDLEEKNSLMHELEGQVDELTLHNEYQLRLKDMDYNEKIKEVTEKFTQDLEQHKNRYELLREEKNDLEMEEEEKIKHMEEAHLHKLQQIEASYQQKIMEEVERYQQLVEERDIQQQRWDQQQKELIDTNETQKAELIDEYEQKLQEDQEIRKAMEEQKFELGRVFSETQRQLEQDVDQEIEELKQNSEKKLSDEREQTLRYKGENGIMKKKFSALTKDIEVQREDLRAMAEKEEELKSAISNLEDEIQLHKKDIRERDETIGEKEKKIYELKKKNQELEKFKFVLDYKIKDLNRQIEPRENEITDMKENITEMDHELEQYHKMNAALDQMIGENREKLDSMQRQIMEQRQRIRDRLAFIDSFQSELHECVQHIQEPAQLKSGVQELYKKFVRKEIKSGELDEDITSEYSRQKEYLEKSVDALKRRLNRDSALHKTDNQRVMMTNMAMVKEINSLRKNVKSIRMMAKDSDSTPASSGPSARPAGAGNDVADRLKRQRKDIGELKSYLKQLEGRMVATRPISREKLPPMDMEIGGTGTGF
jgi:cilia- and flagella-associated protein 57